MELLKYNSSLPYSYVFGAFGTIELLNNQVDNCIAVIVDPSFTKNEAYDKIEKICKEKHIKLIVDLKMINKLRDKGNIFVIGVFKKYTSNLTNQKHLALYNINDVGVIGTIIRSMRGFSYENLVLINCDVDLYHEHLIRSTMGAFFQCNIKQYNDIDSYISEYPNLNYINITSKGNSLESVTNNDNMSLIFSSTPIVIN